MAASADEEPAATQEAPGARGSNFWGRLTSIGSAESFSAEQVVEVGLFDSFTTAQHSPARDPALSALSRESGDPEARASSSVIRRRSSKILRQEVLELLGRENETKSNGVGVFLLLIFVFMSANDNIVKAASKVREAAGEARRFPYDPSSVVLLASGLSVVVGNFLAWLHDGKEGVANCWNLDLLSRMVPISTLFTICTLLKFTSLAYMPADMVALLDQMSLVLMAVLMRVFFGKVYSCSQWASLVLVSLSMLQYMMLRDGDKTNRQVENPAELSQNLLIGLSLMSCQVVISSFAALLGEKLLKQSKAMPFWEQKACMETPATMVCAFSAYVVSPYVMGNRGILENGLFYGWNGSTVCVLAMMMGKLWLSGLVAKLLDTVIKQIGSCAALLVLYFELMLLPPPYGASDMKDFDYRVFVAILVVATSIVSFVATSRQTHEATSAVQRIQSIRLWAETGSASSSFSGVQMLDRAATHTG